MTGGHADLCRVMVPRWAGERGNPAVTRVALLATELGVILRAAELESLGSVSPPFNVWQACEWLFRNPL